MTGGSTSTMAMSTHGRRGHAADVLTTERLRATDEIESGTWPPGP
jgi:hypothetical protein